MSALRQRLKRPGTYLAGVAVLFALALAPIAIGLCCGGAWFALPH